MQTALQTVIAVCCSELRGVLFRGPPLPQTPTPEKAPPASSASLPAAADHYKRVQPLLHGCRWTFGVGRRVLKVTAAIRSRPSGVANPPQSEIRRCGLA
eukprot:14443042-Alexandrium_andersonii.AAC.1